MECWILKEFKFIIIIWEGGLGGGSDYEGDSLVEDKRIEGSGKEYLVKF